MKSTLVCAIAFATLAGSAALAVPPPVTSPAAQASTKAQGELVGVVYFAVDSDELDAAAKKVLAPLVKRALDDKKDILVIVQGHTEKNEAGQDSQYGWGLSQRRASNVRAEFRRVDANGIPENANATTEAFSDSRPPAKGGNARRVEIYFGKGPGW